MLHVCTLPVENWDYIIFLLKMNPMIFNFQRQNSEIIQSKRFIQHHPPIEKKKQTNNQQPIPLQQSNASLSCRLWPAFFSTCHVGSPRPSFRWERTDPHFIIIIIKYSKYPCKFEFEWNQSSIYFYYDEGTSQPGRYGHDHEPDHPAYAKSPAHVNLSSISPSAATWKEAAVKEAHYCQGHQHRH